MEGVSRFAGRDTGYPSHPGVRYGASQPSGREMYTWGRNVHLGYVPQGRFSSPRIHLAASISQLIGALCVSDCLWVWLGAVAGTPYGVGWA